MLYWKPIVEFNDCVLGKNVPVLIDRRDVSGFVRLFYILSKNKIFRIFGGHILDFWSIICRFL